MQLNNPLHVSLGVRRVKLKPKGTNLEMLMTLMSVMGWHLNTVCPWTNTRLQRDVLQCSVRSPLLTCHLGTPMPNFLFSKQHDPLYPPLRGNYSLLLLEGITAQQSLRARSAVALSKHRHSCCPASAWPCFWNSTSTSQPVQQHWQTLPSHQTSPPPQNVPAGASFAGFVVGERAWVRHREPPRLREPQSRWQKGHRFKCLWLPVRTVPQKAAAFENNTWTRAKKIT